MERHGDGSSFSTDSELKAIAAIAGAELYGPDPNGESSTEVPCFLMVHVEIMLIFVARWVLFHVFFCEVLLGRGADP